MLKPHVDALENENRKCHVSADLFLYAFATSPVQLSQVPNSPILDEVVLARIFSLFEDSTPVTGVPLVNFH